MKAVLYSVATLVLFCACVSLAQAQSSAGEREYEYVSKVNIGSDNYLYINVAGNFAYSHGCPQPWYVRSQFPLTDERTKAQMQLALSSFASQSNVYVWTQGCTTYGYPIMIKLQLQQ